MKFICYSNWSQLPGSANALFEQAQKDSIFYSRPWFENVSNVLEDDESLVLACVVDDAAETNEVKAILPLINCEANYYSSLKHRYTTHYSFLLANKDRDAALTCLAQGLSQLPLRSLLLEPVAGDDDRIGGLQQALESNGFSCERVFRFYNWIYRAHEQSSAAYMAGRPSWLRNTISRKKRKLEREHGYDIRLFIGNNVPDAMMDYYSVFDASWKANEQFRPFLDSVVEAFSTRGWSRLAVLYVNEQPIAAQLWFVSDNRANIFRLAYDKQWRDYSPGSILTRYLMEYVFDTDKVDEIDFLTGNESYKQDWMSERRERFALSCIKQSKPTGWREQLVESFRNRLKRD